MPILTTLFDYEKTQVDNIQLLERLTILKPDVYSQHIMTQAKFILFSSKSVEGILC